jgi:predicted DCC family thiol-disulfide oxidoreductase YuxK
MPPLEARSRTMQSLRTKLFESYVSFDTRSLGAFRIALGLACWVELWLRGAEISAFHPSARPAPEWPFSAFSLVYGAALGHLPLIVVSICGVAFTALVLGYRTKWAQLMTVLGVASLAGELEPAASARDAVLGSLCVWSLFMPLGERFSVDATIASLRRREQQAPAELNDRTPIRTPARRFYSLACSAVLVQSAAAYGLSLAAWLSNAGMSSRSMPALTALGTLAMLALFATRYTRAAVVVALPLLNAGRSLFPQLAIFSVPMIAFCPLLLDEVHWRRIAKTLARWHERRVVFVDEDCGFCMWCGRLLARLNVLERLEFASNADQERLPRSISLAQANESITTLEPATGRVRRGAAAFAALLRSLPFGFLAAIPLELPGLQRLAEWSYMRVANNRLQLSIWMGYGACGLPIAESTTAVDMSEKSGAESFRDMTFAIAREACVLAIVAGTLFFRS